MTVLRGLQPRARWMRLVLVVDTVGAGDAFNAGLAVGLSEKKTALAGDRARSDCGILVHAASRNPSHRMRIASTSIFL
jgi:sugar/nucleoside kinase (ribokinase family)